MESLKQNWKLWIFVIGLNVISVCGAFYLRSLGINLYAFRAGN